MKMKNWDRKSIRKVEMKHYGNETSTRETKVL